MKNIVRSIIGNCFVALLTACNNGDDGFPTDPNGGNNPPEVINLHIVDQVGSNFYPFTTAILTGDYFDKDGDKAGVHTFRWTRNGATISGATDYKYHLTAVDAGQSITACVTPKAISGVLTGVEACTSIDVASSIDLSGGPSATVTIDDTTLAFEGVSLSSSYVYTAGTAPEGDSIFFWVILSDNMPSFQLCGSNPCIGAIPANVVGNKIESCVVPVDTNQVPGALACDEVIGAGVSLTGTLEYRQKLVAQVEGFPSDATYHWKVDTDNDGGPSADSNYADVATGALEYTIGTTNQLASLPSYNDINANGIVDDRDWDATSNSLKSAAYYVGKNVQFCAESLSITTGDNFACVEASTVHNDDGSLCNDNTTCVAGGVYFDSSRGITARGIEPAKVIELKSPNSLVNLAGTVYFHRPITIAEYELRDTLGLGSLPAYSSSFTQMGMTWVEYNNAAPAESPSTPLSFCLNLSSGGSSEWHLPVQSDTYNFDDHAGASFGGNAAPTGTGQNLKGLSDGLIYYNLENAVSPTYGWPLDNFYHSASVKNTSSHWALLLSTGWSSDIKDTLPLFTACVRG